MEPETSDAASPAAGPSFGIQTLVDPRRPFARLAGAFMISSIGDPFSLAVSLVLVFDLLHSPFAIAAAYGARALAAILVGGLAGSVTDRVDRRRLLVTLDVSRFAILLAMPLLVPVTPFAIFPCLFLLGGAESLAQPARLAGAGLLAPEGGVDRSNSLLMVSFSIAQAIGFALAGIAITVLPHPAYVYWLDSATFVVSAVLTLTLPSLGGGVQHSRFGFSGFQQLRRPELRPLLLTSGGANLMIGLGAPAMIPLAYLLYSRNGAEAYTWIEVAIIVGLLLGSVVLSMMKTKRPEAAMTYGIAAFGIGALAAAAAPFIVIALAGFAVTGVANAIYSVRNRTALMERASPEEQGAVMSTRYSLAQASQIIGYGLGALVASLATPRGAFVVVGFGMLVVAGLFLIQQWLLRKGAVAVSS